jgi:6-phosphofructokinase 2
MRPSERSNLADIATITLNPALDLTTSVERILPFQKLRCGTIRRDAGGGGINVARVLKRFGAEVLAIHAAGGPTGELLRGLIAQEDLACQVIPVGADTREDFTVFERATANQFRFVEPGCALAEADVVRCVADLVNLQPCPRFVVASGSLPPGSPPDTYARLVTATRNRGARAVVDASGPALACALDAGVFLVKPNLRELTELQGQPLEDRAAAIAACRQLVRTGKAEIVALTLAEQGAIAVTSNGIWSVAAPSIHPVSTVGAGDSFLGAMLWRLVCGDEIPQALRHGVAAGSASILSPGTSLCRTEDVERLLPLTMAETVTP